MDLKERNSLGSKPGQMMARLRLSGGAGYIVTGQQTKIGIVFIEQHITSDVNIWQSSSIWM